MKEEERTNQTKFTNEMQNWIQNQFWFTSEFKKEKGRKDKEKETKEYEIQIKVRHISGTQNYMF